MKLTRKSILRKQETVAGRQRIVEAARAHFFSHGFRSVTMDDLAEELGVSKKTLYAYFPGKTALLEAVLADKFASVEAKLEEIRRAYPHDFPAALHELLANTQRELDDQTAVCSRHTAEGTAGVQDRRAAASRTDPALFWKTFRGRSAHGNGAQRSAGRSNDRDSAGGSSGDRESNEGRRARPYPKNWVRVSR